ncbi:pentatricopeptide repeat-containing protein At4g02750-like, partial [Selaginella moellendorffii]|uniref:pentatricopeptide repeat-containing protein At4g02750-like n=1 Tax=Selaginella moellendorffii TaxID=88036 RepID=UPI000D1C5729
MVIAFAQHGQLQESRRTFDSSLASYNAMLASYAQHRDLERAREIFSSMKLCNLLSWNIMLAAHAQSGGSIEGAKKIFDSMPQRDQISWNSMLLTKNIESAKHVFDETPEKNFLAWNTMLSAYAETGHGDLSSGWRLFCAISSDNSMKPNKDHYGCMIDMLGKRAYSIDAIELLKQMPFVPDLREVVSFLLLGMGCGI